MASTAPFFERLRQWSTMKPGRSYPDDPTVAQDRGGEAVRRTLVAIGLLVTLCGCRATNPVGDSPQRTAFCCARCEDGGALRCDACDVTWPGASCSTTRVECGPTVRSWSSSTGRLVCDATAGVAMHVEQRPTAPKKK